MVLLTLPVLAERKRTKVERQTHQIKTRLVWQTTINNPQVQLERDGCNDGGRTSMVRSKMKCHGMGRCKSRVAMVGVD